MIIQCLIAIDTINKIGATEVYGVSELKNILQEGARVHNYELYFDDRIFNNNDEAVIFLISKK